MRWDSTIRPLWRRSKSKKLLRVIFGYNSSPVFLFFLACATTWICELSVHWSVPSFYSASHPTMRPMRKLWKFWRTLPMISLRSALKHIVRARPRRSKVRNSRGRKWISWIRCCLRPLMGNPCHSRISMRRCRHLCLRDTTRPHRVLPSPYIYSPDFQRSKWVTILWNCLKVDYIISDFSA